MFGFKFIQLIFSTRSSNLVLAKCKRHTLALMFWRGFLMKNGLICKINRITFVMRTLIARFTSFEQTWVKCGRDNQYIFLIIIVKIIMTLFNIVPNICSTWKSRRNANKITTYDKLFIDFYSIDSLMQNITMKMSGHFFLFSFLFLIFNFYTQSL